jgi:hypothetical protein
MKPGMHPGCKVTSGSVPGFHPMTFPGLVSESGISASQHLYRKLRLMKIVLGLISPVLLPRISFLLNRE